MSRDMKAVILLAVMVVAVILGMLAIGVWLAGEVHAEWITISEFRGTQTHATAENVPIEKARKSVSWHFGGNGELERTTLGWKNTRPYVAGSNGIEWFAPTRLNDEFFFYNGNLKVYSITSDSSRSVSTSSVDNIRVYNSGADTAVYRNAAASSKWLELSLSDISSITVRNASFDSIYSTWGGPVNDTLWRTKTQTAAQYNADPDTLVLSGVSVLSTLGPPGIFIANDTTWISDGYQLFKQLGDSSTSISYPTFLDTTTITSTVKAWSTDSAWVLYGNIPDSMITSYGNFLWQPMIDTTPRGIPLIPFFARVGGAEGSTDTLWFAADSGMWGTGRTGTGSGDRVHVRAASACYGLRFLGFPLPNFANNYLVWHDTGSWDYRGSYMGTHYAVFTPNDPTQYLTSEFQYDGRIMRCLQNQRGYCRVIKESGTLKVLVMAPSANLFSFTTTDTASNSLGPSMCVIDDAWRTLRVSEQPRTSLGSNVQSWNWRISCLHRFRAFWAGNPDTLNQLAWSGDNNYDSIAGTELLEGDDPITALSSMDNLQIYQRHKVRALQGSDPSDFYLIPSPSGVGAVNNATVKRDPYSNTDYFCNELGMWNNNGSSVSEVPTACPEIFRDSINWAYESQFTAEIFDRKYWLSCIFGNPYSDIKIGGSVSYKNNRIIVIDLDGSDVTFETGLNVTPMYSHRLPGYKERMFVGDADSTRIVEVGSGNSIARSADWRSSWTDFGSPSSMKRITRSLVTFKSEKEDTLFIDYYGRGYSATQAPTESVLYTDTVEGRVGGGALSRIGMIGDRSLISDEFSIGLRSNQSGMVVINISLDVVAMNERRELR